ncbi:MAG: GNAT family N-acetyltransferase [Bacteroidia bacterium]|nr:GNAT family N-acetyltransferase [Bacteroidia bacterium]MDW8347529.1 GNAT family N-acetyltransferase [Bacteroidia bacterium]
MIEVRKVHRSELGQVLELVKQLATFEKAPQEVTITLEDYERDFEDNIFDVFVAVKDQKVVGMALFYLAYSTWKGKMLYLDDLFVLPEYRNQGIGSRLFDAVLVEAQEQQCNLVKWQVLDWNVDAQKFYTKYQTIVEKDWWNGKILLSQKEKR